METWRNVIGYEGYYKVSNHGNIKGVDRIAKGKNGVSRPIKGRPMTKSLSSQGYYRVRLSKNGVAKSANIHVLVATAFNGKRPDGYDIHHEDGDKTNNHISNLVYLSRQEHIGGERHYATNLTDKNVMEIRKRFIKGDSLHRIAYDFQLAYGSVRSIVRGDNWKHLPVLKRKNRRTKGSKNPASKLDEKSVLEIRKLWHEGQAKTYKEIADIYGVTYQTIQYIITEKTWRHVKYQAPAK